MTHHDDSGARARLSRGLHTIEGQHRKLREVQEELDRALAKGHGSQAAMWLNRLEASLTAHFEVEESLVFPVVSELDAASATSVGQLTQEHGVVLEKLQILSSASVESLRADLPLLRELLAAHESLEEDVVLRVLGNGDKRPAVRAERGPAGH